MPVKAREMSRSDWPRVEAGRFAYKKMVVPGFDGAAGLLRFDKLSAPVVKGGVAIADEGFAWLQLAPRYGHWWLTAMFDAEGRIVQYYFDVTRENVIGDSDSRFYDMFLDVVALPDGSTRLLDMDELESALADGDITDAEYALAVQTADALARGIPANVKRLERFCRETADALEPALYQRQ